MKKLLIIFTLIAAVLLAACTQGVSGSICDIELDGESYTVNVKEKTITHRDIVYQYQLEEDVRILYPNGADFYRGEGSSNYDPERYVPGETLVKAVRDARSLWSEKSLDIGGLLKGALLCIFSAFFLFCPHVLWYLCVGWRFRDAEPSDLYLWIVRIGAGVAGLVGIITVLVAIF